MHDRGARPTPGLALDGDDGAAARMVRGHLELSGITTADELGGGHHAGARPGGGRPGRPAAGGVRPPGPLHARPPTEHRVGGPPPAGPDAQLLAPVPARERPAGHRPGLHAVPAALAARGAGHPARRRRRPGDGHRAAPGLRGRRRRVGARAAGPPAAPLRARAGWTASATTARWPGSGWPRAPAADADGPAAAPSKATPIAVVFRADLGWLLEAARAGAPPAEPTVGATAEIIEVLRQRGASFASDLAAATRRLPDDVERGLWDGVTRGLIMCDGFGAIRARVAGSRGPAAAPARLSRLGRAAPADGRRAAGRWALVPRPGRRHRPRRAGRGRRRAAAATVGASCSATWPCTTRSACRGATSSGPCAGSRTGAWSGAAGSSPGSAASSTPCPRRPSSWPTSARSPRTGERVVVNATDPLNLVGVIVPGDAVPAVRTNRVAYVDGLPEAQ